MARASPDAGRPPDTPVTRKYLHIVRQELVRIRDKARVPIFPRFYEDLSWFRQRAAFDCLLVLEEPGRLTVRDWDTSSPAVLNRLEALAQDALTDTGATSHMRLLLDKYRLIHIGSDSRLRLTATPLRHLRITGEEGTYVYLTRYPTTLEILAEWRRDELITDIPVELQDLP